MSKEILDRINGYLNEENLLKFLNRVRKQVKLGSIVKQLQDAVIKKDMKILDAAFKKFLKIKSKGKISSEDEEVLNDAFEDAREEIGASI